MGETPTGVLAFVCGVFANEVKMENPGIDPGASRMQIERSTT